MASTYIMQSARDLREELAELIRDLQTTDFDPTIGSKLRRYARDAGLTNIRELIQPYHWIVGKPDGEAAGTWRRKIRTLKENYVTRLFPAKRHLASMFDRMEEFILSADTMTWSLLYLVQGTVPH